MISAARCDQLREPRRGSTDTPIGEISYVWFARLARPIAMPATISLRRATLADLDEIVDVDDDSGTLYAEHGVTLGLTPAHPFCVAERARWTRSIARGDTYLALEREVVGIAVLGLVDGAPYLDQLSVRRASMRRGIGRALVEGALAWAGERPLWLTTYAHLPFNRPFYESMGFTSVDEAAWGPELAAIVREQRGCLPHPEQRCAMRHARQR